MPPRGHGFDDMTSGPLDGLRVVELASIGPVPFACMLLADLGADVIRIDRPAQEAGLAMDPALDILGRSRRSMTVDLRHPEGAAVILRLVDSTDVLVEGYRPGVAERLGVGPQPCQQRNPALVYGRVTGWGRHGPLAPTPGHDIDFLALSGALHPLGPADRAPTVPLNYVADFGGGGMLLAVGVLAALVERSVSGAGQVVDAAMIDGAALQTALLHSLLAMGRWTTEREANLLDGGAPFYRTYACADGTFLAVGALEPPFYAELLERLELDHEQWPQWDRKRWPEQRAALAALFATRTRAEWEQTFAGSQACVAPVLTPTEAPSHPHHTARGTFTDVNGLVQPRAAPRFSRTQAAAPGPSVTPGAHTDEILAEAGYDAAERARLREQGTVA